MPVQHRTRPLLCHVGLHRPSWIRVPALRRVESYRVCAGCGLLLEDGGYWDTAATTLLVISPLLAAGLTAASLSIRASHRSRR